MGRLCYVYYCDVIGFSKVSKRFSPLQIKAGHRHEYMHGSYVTEIATKTRFSSLFAAGDVSRGGTSATQRQKFHTDDVNQCLLNKSGSHGVPNANLFNFTFL